MNVQLERILVPVDFSESSLIAVRQASALARRFHSEVTLLHVNEFLALHTLTGLLGFGIASTEAERAEHMRKRQKDLNEFGVADLSGIAVKRVVLWGDPAEVIVERAHQDKVSLILMPTRGQGAFRRYLLGSVTAKVLYDAECPVWTGTHRAVAPAAWLTEVRHVMCAVNLGPSSAEAVNWAAALASEFDATLTVVYTVLNRHSDAGDRLHKLLLDLGVEAEMLVLSDADIPRALSTAAENSQADLLVIGRSRADGSFASHAYGIVGSAPCPVVSL